MDKFINKAQKIKDKLSKLIPKEVEYHVIITETDITTFRYANNEITQNTNEINISLNLTLRKGLKEAVCSSTVGRENDLEKIVHKGLEMLRFVPDDPQLPPLLENYSLPFEKRNFPLNSPENIIQAIGKINRLADSKQLKAFGASHNEKTKLYIANSRGLEVFDAGDLNTITLITYNKEGLSGYAGEGYHDIEDLDIESFFHRAAKKCNYPILDKKIELGDYEVLLEAPAVATMLNTLSFIAFSEGLIQEGRSFISGKKGQKLFPEYINLLDDPYHPLNRSLRIDYEGVTKKKTYFVEKGVVVGGVHNLRTAQKDKTTSTGHASPPPEKYPFPVDATMETGTHTLEEMVSQIKKGLYITRFHYIGIIDEAKTTITGMTRDGTFWVENGEIIGSIGDLRFTDDMIRIFQNTTSIENKLYKEPGFLYGANIAPSLTTKIFKITGFKPKEK